MCTILVHTDSFNMNFTINVNTKHVRGVVAHDVQHRAELMRKKAIQISHKKDRAKAVVAYYIRDHTLN